MKLLFRNYEDSEGYEREIYIAAFSTFARAQHYAELFGYDFRIVSVDQIDVDPIIPPEYLKYVTKGA